MFEYIRGNIIYTNNDYVVLDNNGIGYKLLMNSKTIKDLEIREEKNGITLYTYLLVRENIMDIYGFISYEELEFFKTLLNLSGVGSKTALKIIEDIAFNDFIQAINSENLQRLQKISGIGKKMAQKMIIELKNKFETTTKEDNTENMTKKEMVEEVKSVLVNLGYGATEAKTIIIQIYKEGITIEELVKESLKQITSIKKT